MLFTCLWSRGLWSRAFINWYRFPSMYSMQMCSLRERGSRKMSSAGTRWGCVGNVRRKMTSRSSKHGANESNVFFIVLIATYQGIKSATCVMKVSLLSSPMPTIVPLRAMFDPAVRTRATPTLPKLPSPISFITSNLSSRVAIEVGAALLGGCSYVMVMVTLWCEVCF